MDNGSSRIPLGTPISRSAGELMGCDVIKKKSRYLKDEAGKWHIHSRSGVENDTRDKSHLKVAVPFREWIIDNGQLTIGIVEQVDMK